MRSDATTMLFICSLAHPWAAGSRSIGLGKCLCYEESPLGLEGFRLFVMKLPGDVAVQLNWGTIFEYRITSCLVRYVVRWMLSCCGMWNLAQIAQMGTRTTGQCTSRGCEYNGLKVGRDREAMCAIGKLIRFQKNVFKGEKSKDWGKERRRAKRIKFSKWLALVLATVSYSSFHSQWPGSAKCTIPR